MRFLGINAIKLRIIAFSFLLTNGIIYLTICLEEDTMVYEQEREKKLQDQIISQTKQPDFWNYYKEMVYREFSKL